jgi:hypothetical protein
MTPVKMADTKLIEPTTYWMTIREMPPNTDTLHRVREVSNENMVADAKDEEMMTV